MKRIYFYVFTAVFFVTALAYALNGVYPFGGGSVLTGDLQSQYIDFITAFFTALKSGDNFFVTHQSGLGSNLYAVILYIASDPFNFLFYFFDPKYYQEIYYIIICIKISLAGMFFAMYCKNTRLFELDNKAVFALSLCYALSACTLRAAENPMWLINIALLPLVLLGIERMPKRPLMFYITVTCCFITNYYLAYMTGLFALIYFFYIKKNDSFKIFGQCTIFTLLAAGTAMYVILPSFYAVASGYTSIVGTGLENNMIKYTPADVLFFFTAVIDGFTASGYPNAFCGMIILWLAAAYFLNTNIPLSKKISSAVVLMIFALSLVFTPLYAVWHIFRAPTGFEGRFLYTAVMFILILAAQSLNNLKYIPRKKFCVCGAVLFAAAVLCAFKKINFYYFVFYLVMAFFMALFALLIIKNARGTMLYAVIAAEISISAFCVINRAAVRDGYAPHENHVIAATRFKNDFKALYESDDSFYRCDTDIQGSYNTALTAGFASIAHYSSLADQKTFEIMRRLGVQTLSDNKIVLPLSQNIVLDSIFGVKYFGVTDKNSLTENKTVFNFKRMSNPYYVPYMQTETACFYQNKLAFPIMFAANEPVTDPDKDYFENQTLFLNTLLNTDKNLYKKYEFDDIRQQNCILTQDADGFLTAAPKDNTSEAVIIFTVKIPQDGNYFTVLDGDFPENALVPNICGWISDETNIPILRMDSELKDLGQYHKDDTAVLVFHCNYESRIRIPQLYCLDNAVFAELSEKANQNGLLNIRLEHGNIRASSDLDKDSLIFCSLAYDKGFEISLDGKKIPSLCLADGFLGYELPKGRHDIQISYISPLAREGALISAVFLTLSFFILYLQRRRDNNYDKKIQ